VRNTSTFLALSNAFVAQGRFAAAEDLYNQAIRTADPSPADYLEYFSPPLWMLPSRTNSRVNFALNVPYPELVKLLVAQGKDELALGYATRGRSRLLEAIIQRRVLGQNSLKQFANLTLSKLRAIEKEMNSDILIYWTVLRSDPDDRYVIELWAWIVRKNGEIRRRTLPLHVIPGRSSAASNDGLAEYVKDFHSTLPIAPSIGSLALLRERRAKRPALQVEKTTLVRPRDWRPRHASVPPSEHVAGHFGRP
jgi:hypothetical protein